MLRVFVDTYNKSSSVEENGINIQRVSFDNICSSSESIESFKKVIEQYAKNKDEVAVLTLDSKVSKAYDTFKPLFNDKLISVINTSLPMGGIDIIVKLVLTTKNRSLEGIESDVKKLSEAMNSFYLVLSLYRM